MLVSRSAEHPPQTRAYPLPTLQRLVDRSAGSVAMTVLRNDLVDGEWVPEHRHDVEEVLVVAAGGCRVDVGGESCLLGAGDAVVVPAHTRHGFRHSGDGPATVIAVLASPDVLIPRLGANQGSGPTA